VELLIYRRSSIGPDAGYKDSGVDDSQGRCIFSGFPTGLPEPADLLKWSAP
jgi:hypothetical protein